MVRATRSWCTTDLQAFLLAPSITPIANVNGKWDAMPAKFTRRLAIAGPIAMAAGLSARSATAEAYPSRTITLVVPYGAGSGVDTTARIIAPSLGQSLNQAVVVINKPGAGAIVGTEYVSHQAPDGYTLLLSSVDMVIGPALYKNLPYDAARDFTPITELATVPLFVIVKGDSPIRSVQDLITAIRAHPEKANYSSGSALFWVTTELFLLKAGVKATRVPYRDAGAMTLAVMGGEVLFAISGAGPVITNARSGSIRVLATTVPHRVPIFPDVPTLAEVGIPGIDVSGWHGIWAPAKTPPQIIKTLDQTIREVLASPPVRKAIDNLNLIIVGSSTADFQTEINSKLALWKDLAKKSNISAEL